MDWKKLVSGGNGEDVGKGGGERIDGKKQNKKSELMLARDYLWVG